MSHTSEITLDIQPDGKRHRVTLSTSGEPIKMDTLNLFTEKHCMAFIQAVCEKCPGLDADQLETLLLKEAAKASADSKAAPRQAERDPLEDTPADIRQEAEDLLRDPELVGKICDDIALMGVAGERELTATLYLVGVSRLLSHPLAAIVCGSSSSGKSYTLERVASLFSDEAVIHAQQMTPQALFHMPKDSLKHRWIVAGERSRLENDNTAEATRALREMLASGRLTKMMPVKTGQRIETELIEQDGPIAYCETTTLGDIFEEDKNRCLLLQTDESEAQTRRITKALAERHTMPRADDERERIRQVHQTLQRLLPHDASVVIPFAPKLQEAFPCDRIESRRVFEQLTRVIEASALLHFRQRTTDADRRIVATPDDYTLVSRLLRQPFAQSLADAPPQAALDFWKKLPEEPFTVKAEAKRQRKSDKSVHRWVKQLDRAGLVIVHEASQGRRPTTWKRLAGASGSTTDILPDPQKVFPCLGVRN